MALLSLIVSSSLPYAVRALPHALHTLATATRPKTPEEELESAAFWEKIGLSLILVLLGGAFAGPVAWPIAKLLDYALGAEGPTTYKKAELKSFLQFHRNPNSQFGTYIRPGTSDGENPFPLSDEEISILNGVLTLNDKRVTDIMTPMEDVVTLSADALLDHELVDHILTSGYSRFPVHEPGRPLAFRGFLLVKRLLLYDPSSPKQVKDFKLLVLPEAKPSISCFQALDYFQTGRAHLLLVSKTPGYEGGALGVVTLEDIIEEIITEEIVDETDVYQDMHTKQRAKRQSTAAIMRGIVEREERMRHRQSNASITAGSYTGSSSYPGTPSIGAMPLLSATPVKPSEISEAARLLTPIHEAASINSREGSGGESGGNTPKVEQPNGHRFYGTIPLSQSPPKQ
ncbi:hypothetical protein FRB99_001338 [Tulasnella sp. 403]|nr:hypothetical protein FRB99_001338 [Tulasnella sp. 403]